MRASHKLSLAFRDVSRKDDLFSTKGARIYDLPALVIRPPEQWAPLDNALEELENFHWIIFSSTNGVRAVEKRLQLMGKSLAHVALSIVVHFKHSPKVGLLHEHIFLILAIQMACDTLHENSVMLFIECV